MSENFKKKFRDIWYRFIAVNLKDDNTRYYAEQFCELEIIDIACWPEFVWLIPVCNTTSIVKLLIVFSVLIIKLKAWSAAFLQQNSMRISEKAFETK